MTLEEIPRIPAQNQGGREQHDQNSQVANRRRISGQRKQHHQADTDGERTLDQADHRGRGGQLRDRKRAARHVIRDRLIDPQGYQGGNSHRPNGYGGVSPRPVGPSILADITPVRIPSPNRRPWPVSVDAYPQQRAFARNGRANYLNFQVDIIFWNLCTPSFTAGIWVSMAARGAEERMAPAA